MKRKVRSSSSTNDERKSKKTKKITDIEEIQEMSKLDFSSAEELFSSLVAPTTSEAFFSEYWEKKPLLIKREDTAFYGPLFTKSDLEAILKKEEIEFINDVNVCSYEDGDKLYMNGDMGTRATWSRVSKHVEERNATVQFHQPQRFKDILWKLNAHLERMFGCLVGANVYITPSNSQGLAPHYDDVEVFILQLEGKKQWKLYKPPTELPQDYSTDLEQDSIGEPTHEFELQPGDMVYFPRGTVHQAVTLKGDSHSTHVTLSTYQQHSWGNLLSNVISDAIDKAMEADVEFRRGLPVNCYSYIGLGMQNNEKFKDKQEDFNNQVKHLLTRLVNHIETHGSVDKAAVDFIANRLPPIEQKEEAMKDDKGDGKPPTEDSEVKFRYPEHVRISLCDGLENPYGLSTYDSDMDSDDEDMTNEEDEDSEDDEAMEESEEKKQSTKSSKSKKKSENKAKQEKTKLKGKKKKQIEESEGEEEEVESSDEGSKAKRKKSKTEKDKKTKSKKGKKSPSDEDDDEDKDQKMKSKKSNGKKYEQTKKKKSKKGNHCDSDDEEDDDDDTSFEIGDEDTDDSDDDEESNIDDGPWVFVHHSLNNDSSSHMMGPQQPSIVKFSMTYKDALLHLYSEKQHFIPVKSLPLESDDTMYLLTSLWSEGLIAIKD